MSIRISDGWIYEGNESERFLLGQPGIRNMLVFGVNPSTAVPGRDDPTIKKVRMITGASGYDGWIVANLYPAITSRPDELPKTPDKRLLDKNLDVLNSFRQECRIDAVLAAWGDAIDKRDYLGEILYEIYEIMDGDFQWYYRGSMTKRGNPRHPLYMKEQEEFKWFPVFDYLSYYVNL